MRRLLPWVLVVGLACSKDAGLTSNFKTVAVVEHTIVDAKTQVPYTGTLVARDQEIRAIAPVILGDTYAYAAGESTTGLVLVLPVANGVAAGRATVYVDLDAPKLHPEIARRSQRAQDLARARGGTLKLAEATFVAGKLDGTAVVYEPGAKGSVKRAEVPFREHALHGTAIEYVPGTAKPLREIAFERGVESGPQRWFHRNGKLHRVGRFVAGVPDGELAEYYATGAVRSTVSYAAGTPVGTHRTFYPSGTPRSEQVYGGETVIERRWYSNGVEATSPPNGVIEEFHDTGVVHTRTTYVDGVEQGAYEVFYDDGTPWKRGHHEAGQLHGPYKEWWKNGKLATDATYVAGALDGAYKRFYANGKPWEAARYERGALTGPYRKWWKNGKPAHVYAYKAGKLDGDYQLFYDNGAKWAVGTYADGKPQGALERWFRDGTLGYVMHHADGRPHGPYKRWWPSGTPRLDATHVRGQLDGDYKNWLEDGTLYEQATYARGRKVTTTRPVAPR